MFNQRPWEALIEQSWQQYWNAYVLGHRRLATRLIHYLGLFLVPLGTIIAVLVSRSPWPLIAVPIFYIAARQTHPELEHNSNRDFATRPAWSVMAFAKMMLFDLNGRMSGEIARASQATSQ